MKLPICKLLVWASHVVVVLAWLVIMVFLWTAMTAVGALFWLALAALVYLKAWSAARRCAY